MDSSALVDTFPLHVLVVDDDATVLEHVTRRLTSAGHRVTTRSTAIGTRGDIVALRPDLVLLDVTMPGLRGDDFAVLLGMHPATADTAVVLHCAEGKDVRRQTGALGVIRKTNDDAAFLRQFRKIAEKLFEGTLPCSAATQKFSGTHRIATSLDATTPVAQLSAAGVVSSKR